MSETTLSADEALALIDEKRTAAQHAQQALEDAIEVARDAGASWAEIGQVLDTSKQNAHRKYGVQR